MLGGLGRCRVLRGLSFVSNSNNLPEGYSYKKQCGEPTPQGASPYSQLISVIRRNTKDR